MLQEREVGTIVGGRGGPEVKEEKVITGYTVFVSDRALKENEVIYIQLGEPGNGSSEDQLPWVRVSPEEDGGTIIVWGGGLNIDPRVADLQQGALGRPYEIQGSDFGDGLKSLSPACRKEAICLSIKCDRDGIWRIWNKKASQLPIRVTRLSFRDGAQAGTSPKTVSLGGMSDGNGGVRNGMWVNCTVWPFDSDENQQDNEIALAAARKEVAASKRQGERMRFLASRMSVSEDEVWQMAERWCLNKPETKDLFRLLRLKKRLRESGSG